MDLRKLHNERSLLLGHDHHCSVVGVILSQLNQNISYVSGAETYRCRVVQWQMVFVFFPRAEK